MKLNLSCRSAATNAATSRILAIHWKVLEIEFLLMLIQEFGLIINIRARVLSDLFAFSDSSIALKLVINL